MQGKLVWPVAVLGNSGLWQLQLCLAGLVMGANDPRTERL